MQFVHLFRPRFFAKLFVLSLLLLKFQPRQLLSPQQQQRLIHLLMLGTQLMAVDMAMVLDTMVTVMALVMAVMGAMEAMADMEATEEGTMERDLLMQSL